MDEIAFITAKKFAQKNVVTVSVENVKFIKPIKQGEIIEFLGSIENFDKLKIFVKIEVFRDCINNNDKEKVLESHFIMVCVDENNRLLRLK